VVSNIGACALFAALTGSSPATCAAIGKMGIPEMQKRGYGDDLATGAIAAAGSPRRRSSPAPASPRSRARRSPPP